MSAVDKFSVADWVDRLSKVAELSWVVEEDRLSAVLGADPVEVLWALDIFNILHYSHDTESLSQRCHLFHLRCSLHLHRNLSIKIC